jgi:predicted RNA-binding protein YlqC (UPF0109 family)
MPKRVPNTTKPNKGNGEDKAKPREFIKLLKTDIKDLEIGDKLKRLANIQVNDWEIRRPKRAVKAVAKKAKATGKKSNHKDKNALHGYLENFLHYVATSLIDEPARAQIHVVQISPTVVRLKLVLAQRDLSMLVGRGGDTAEVIRSILKARGREFGVDVLLQIISHENNDSLSKHHPSK